MIVIINNESLEVPDDAILADLVAIADEKLHYGDRGMCVLNGALCEDYSRHVNENDRIDLIPVLEGG